MTRRPDNRSGLTLLEMTIVVALATVIFITSWSMFVQTSAEAHFNITSTDLDLTMRRCIDRLTEEIANSGQEPDGTDHVITHPKADTTVLSEIQFQVRVGFTGDPDLDWSEVIWFKLDESPLEDPNNQIDDDGDGVIDEQQLVRVQGAVTSTLADNITQFEVTRNAGDDFVSIRVGGDRTSKQSHETIPMHRELTTVIALSNRD